MRDEKTAQKKEFCEIYLMMRAEGMPRRKAYMAARTAFSNGQKRAPAYATFLEWLKASSRQETDVK